MRKTSGVQGAAPGTQASRLVYVHQRLQPAAYDGLHRPMAHAITHELVVVLRGAYSSLAGGDRVEAGAGDVVYYGPGELHAPRRTGTGDLLTVSVSWMEARGSGEAPRPRLVHDRHGRMRALAQWMVELYPPRGPADGRALDAMLDLLLLAHAQAGMAGAPSLEDTVRAYTHAHLREPFLLADLARAAGLSPFHFARAFRRETGTSPMAYARRLRAEAAAEMILHTEAPLAEIAAAVGLGDLPHFSRVFKQVMGKPPSALRRG